MFLSCDIAVMNDIFFLSLVKGVQIQVLVIIFLVTCSNSQICE